MNNPNEVAESCWEEFAPRVMAQLGQRERVEINICPAARDALQALLHSDPRFASVGYSEFIIRAVYAANEVADAPPPPRTLPYKNYGIACTDARGDRFKVSQGEEVVTDTTFRSVVEAKAFIDGLNEFLAPAGMRRKGEA